MAASYPFTGSQRRWRGVRAVALVLLFGLLAQLLGPGNPAYAAVDDISPSEMRELAAFDLVEGGPSVRRAAETALLGSDEDVRTYYWTGRGLRCGRSFDSLHSNVNTNPSHPTLQRVESFLLPAGKSAKRTLTLRPNAVTLFTYTPVPEA